jgi:hypothetical protein
LDELDASVDETSHCSIFPFSLAKGALAVFALGPVVWGFHWLAEGRIFLGLALVSLWVMLAGAIAYRLHRRTDTPLYLSLTIIITMLVGSAYAFLV